MPLRVIHIYGSREFGGVARYLASMARMVRLHGGVASVVATNPDVVSYCEAAGMETIAIPGIERSVNPVRDLIAVTKLVRHLRKHRYTIVHTHTSKGGALGRLAARAAGVPIVIHTAHGDSTDSATNPFSKRMFSIVEHCVSRCGDFVIAVNAQDRKNAIHAHIVSAASIATVANGIDLRTADDELSRDCRPVFDELRLDPARPVVGVLGRLVPQKGLRFFIDAIPMIRARVPQTQFIVAGSGELEPELRVRAQRIKVLDSVCFTGFRSDAFRILKAMTIFVMPSLWEGLPIALLEAMAARLPIIATRIKGIVDVFEGTQAAVLVEPRSSEAIARSVLALLGDESERSRLGRAARERVERAFSEMEMLRNTWSLYETVAQRKGISLATNA